MVPRDHRNATLVARAQQGQRLLGQQPPPYILIVIAWAFLSSAEGARSAERDGSGAAQATRLASRSDPVRSGSDQLRAVVAYVVDRQAHGVGVEQVVGGGARSWLRRDRTSGLGASWPAS
ncbi:MAG TPA: hypothetical protein VEJ84_05555 [Acidimicrobiales bacterium]|nr:hypothetical protein [Acidimicrobiales bacterium]